MANVDIKTKRHRRLAQGDIYREIEHVEYVIEKRGIIEVSKIVFPLVVVLSQDCDLEWDSFNRGSNKKTDPLPTNQDKKILSILVAPLYNAEHVWEGKHLSDIGLNMRMIAKTKTEGNNIRKNETPRYHYFDFAKEVPVVASIIDFKHYFSANVDYLERIRSRNFLCQLSPLYREDLSQRFASYLARIGLPELKEKDLPTFV